MKGVKARKILGFIGVLVVFLSLIPLFAPKVAASLPSADIMPLGDSITVGLPDIDGYRKFLYQDLAGVGFDVDFVGSQITGSTGYDRDHEGHSGWSADQVSVNINTWLASNPADVVLLHIGTNDVKVQAAAGIVAEVEDILDNIDAWGLANGRSVTVVLAKIILRSDDSVYNQTTMNYNNLLVSMASTRSNVVIVDMAQALSYPADLDADGIHPNTSGYQKMADVWYEALVDVLGYSLTVNSVGNGDVTVNPDRSAYAYATDVDLTAVAYDGWVFSGWSGDLGGSDNTETIEMNANRTVTATFTRIQYKLTISSNFGSTNPSIGEYWYDSGSEVIISASPPSAGPGERYTWQGWSGVGLGSYTGTAQQATIEMDGPVTQTASWLHEYKLTLSADAGSISPYVGEDWYAAGDSVEVSSSPPTSIPDMRYSWSGWAGSGVGSYTGINNPISIVMNGPVSETASWNVEYKLTISTAQGNPSPSAGEHWYAAGASVSVGVLPSSAANGVQYACTGWSGAGSVPASGSASDLTFSISEPSTLEWLWKTQYYLTVTSPYGTVGGVGWYDSGSTAYATINPTSVTSAGNTYVFSQWSGDASGVSSTSSAIAMNGPKTAVAFWSQSHNSPAPTATPTPHITPKPTATPIPTALPTPSSEPTVSPFPSSTGEPSSTPTATSSDGVGSNTYLIILIIGIAIACASVGFFVFRRSKN